MKLGYFIGGSSVLLVGWLALTFVTSTPPADGSKSKSPRAVDRDRVLPDEAGLPASGNHRILPISLSQ